jgi:hypothetical protein
MDTIVKKTGQLFTVLTRVTDGRMAHGLIDGESYRGHLYDVYQIDKSDKMVELVYTQMRPAIFGVNELEELGVDCILHSRLKSA